MCSPIKNIRLAFPCQENWDKMTNNEKGKFCEKCGNQVVDFRDKSKDELENEIFHSNTRVCGRFNKSQLSNSFLKYAASAVIASSLAIPAIGQESIPKNSTEIIDDSDVIFGQMENHPYPKGGWKGFYERLSKEIRVPIDLATKTRVFVEFAIDTNGKMVDIRVVKSDDPRLSKEAIRTLEALSEKFEPATLQGVPIRVKQVVPIWFDPKKD